MSRRTIPGAWITRTDGSRAWRMPYRDPGRPPDVEDVRRRRATRRELPRSTSVSAPATGTWVAPDAGRERFVDFGREWARSTAQDWPPAPASRSAPTSGGSSACSATPAARRGRPARAEAAAGASSAPRLRRRRRRSRCTTPRAIMRVGVPHRAHPPRRHRRREARRVRRWRRGPTGSAPTTSRPATRCSPSLPPPQPRYRAIVALGACGLRISEALGVTVDRLDLDRRVLVVDRQLVRIDGRPAFKLPKREKTRTIELPTWACLELRRHLRDHGPFWPMHGARQRRAAVPRRPGRPAAPRRLLRLDLAAGARRRRAAPDRYVFHSLRHWCATTLLAAGAPITGGRRPPRRRPRDVMRTYAHWLRDDRHLPAPCSTRCSPRRRRASHR